MTQSKKNRSWSSEEKLQIIKSHLVGGKSVSQICEEHNLAPSLYYKWQSMLFDNAAPVLENKTGRHQQHKSQSRELTSVRKELDKTRQKLADKHEVLSEVMSEYVQLKKTLGV